MKKLLIALLIAGAVGGFAYYKFGGEKELQYMTIHASRGDVVETVLASGTLVGRNEVEVGAQVNGQIQKLYVKLGDKVKKGDMIAEIDPRTQLNSLSSAKAEAEKRRRLSEVAHTIATRRSGRKHALND